MGERAHPPPRSAALPRVRRLALSAVGVRVSSASLQGEQTAAATRTTLLELGVNSGVVLVLVRRPGEMQET